jgi:hypothetical protein
MVKNDNMDISKLTIDEMVELRSQLNSAIFDYKDGFEYDCKIRSYGRNRSQTLYNTHSVQELCWEYDGDDGIVDVYTNNAGLQIENYGSTYYFPTKEDAKRWRRFIYIKNSLPGWKKEWEEWNNPVHTPFRERAWAAPSETEETIAMYEAQIAADENTIVMPVALTYNYKEEDY